jgi:hypothetical protein
VSESAALVARAARQEVALPETTARRLARRGQLEAARKVNAVCQIVRTSRKEDAELRFGAAMKHLEDCGGDVELALRRLLESPLERRRGVHELLEYAADRGIELQPSTIAELRRVRGDDGARRHLDDVAKILDTAYELRRPISQRAAVRRLNEADGEAHRVVAKLLAERRRHDDRMNGPCMLRLRRRSDEDLSQRLAECACRGCSGRLAERLGQLIDQAIARRPHTRRDPEEARSQAYLELMLALDTWRGGTNFRGYFWKWLTAAFESGYSSTPEVEREMLPLDADFLRDSPSGEVTLEERVPDRTVDVATTVILLDELRRMVAQRRREWEERALEYLELSA